MKKILTIIFTITLFALTFGNDIIGTGYGSTEREAKENALNDLSQQIRVTVESNYSSENIFKNGEVGKNLKNNVNLFSRNELLGVEYKVKKYFLRKKYRVRAFITDKKLPLYESKVETLKNQIHLNMSRVEKTDSLAQKKELLEKSITDFGLYEDYKNMAFILGSKKTFSIQYTQAQLKNQLGNINAILDAPRIVFVSLTGDFPDESYAYIKNRADDLITKIFNHSSKKLAIVNDMNENVNTIFNININSYVIDKKEPILYNNKPITKERFEAFINLSITAQNKEMESYIISKTSSATSYDVSSRKSAMYKAIDLLFKKEENELKNSFSF
ncbi:LPP20 family lipoprotein [uncultured Ilyobacter sp.]|uniref:LPP20 family lipoprotein n=1 Tax=uncultured Ilyobacter sp. TaxID=544433 RepID=UPI0029C98B87|nr:LPP20 family lipoprotein [uncultured Ilyobacter sp.]